MSASRQQLLNELGRALASVGHELNNLVGVVQSYAAFIQERTTDAEILADAQVIRATTDKAATLARQLLAFGHPREHEPEALELGPFIIDLQGFLRRILGEACPVSAQVGRDPAVVLVRRAQLGRQLLDLALAACGVFAENSGLRLGVTVHERAEGRTAELWLREDRKRDAAPKSGAVSAIDVDLDAMRAVLAPFDGELHAAVTSPQGVVISLTFPALDALEAPAASLERVEARGSETVLVVEENGELRSAMCRMLEAAGYRALEAEDGTTARSLGLEGGVAVDLLLTSGGAAEPIARALVAELRHQHPNLAVIQPAKPFSSAELQGAVRAALDDRARLSQKVPLDATRVLALVVDDDAHVRLALSRILSDVGADVVTAPSGLHALQKLQALPVDLLIADQLMPGMEGTRLLETAYRTWPRIVRVVYTGYLSSGLVVDAVNRANVHKVLAKDMPPEWLRQQLGEVIDEIRAARPA